MNSNINYWKNVLISPTKEFKNLLKKEQDFLIENVPKNSKVLDVCCGDGRCLKVTSANTKYLFGVDNDKEAINLAKENLNSIKGYKLIKATASKLPFLDKFFDVVILFDAFHNLADLKEQVLLEIKRVIKNDGILLLSTYSEKAFDKKLNLYKSINIKINSISGNTFHLGNNVISEQFSIEEIKNIVSACGLKISFIKSVSDLAYLLKISKIN